MIPIAAIVALALSASVSSLGNGFAYDDMLIIRENQAVHSLGDIGQTFVVGYWPREHGGALYRPLVILGYALQWAIGRGSPSVFHVVSVGLYVLASILVFLIARAVLPPPAAWLGAALCAVQPVHVEAVGNCVGQAELTAALWTLTAIWLYLRARQRPTFRARESVGLFCLLLLAAGSKEQGVLLPVLLLATELTVVADQRPWPQRLRVVLPTYLLLVVGAVIALVTRYAALGSLVGEYPLRVLTGLTPLERIYTTLGLAPEWFRLLLWPAHLSAEYGPPAFGAAHSFGTRQLLGLLLVGGSIGLAATTWRRLPAVSWGITWAALTILPVSNLLVPTGLLVAERTLFLPSVGGLLAVAALAYAALQQGVVASSKWKVRLAYGALAGVLAAGLWRSATRQPVWRDNPTIVQQTVRDAPGSYRSWYDYGLYLYTLGRRAEAQRALEHAAALFADDARVFSELGRVIHDQQGCGPAAPYWERALAVDSGSYMSRGRLYLCLQASGDSVRALALAEQGARMHEPYFQLVMARAGRNRHEGGAAESTARAAPEQQAGAGAAQGPLRDGAKGSPER